MAKTRVKVYRSPKLGLTINAEPEVKLIQFVNGEFKTSDKKQQDLLENHRGFGLWIFLDGAVEKPEARKPEKPKDEVDADVVGVLDGLDADLNV